MSIILGIDPGLQHTGWGIIASKDNSLIHIASGVIHTDPTLSLPERLRQLNHDLQQVLVEHTPAYAAIESTFVNKNGASTLKLGQARGALLLTLAQAALPIAEYAPNTVKQGLVGRGHAEKSQVAAMVNMLLSSCPTGLTNDATDALAIAICHAHQLTAHKILETMT